MIGLFDAGPAVSAELAVILPVIAFSEPLSALVFVGDGIYLGASRFAFLAVTTVRRCDGDRDHARCRRPRVGVARGVDRERSPWWRRELSAWPPVTAR